MADSNTAIADLFLMETGQHNNDWGTNLNTVISNIETMTKATRTNATTGGTTTLSKTTAREIIQRVTGVLVSNAIIEVPAAATAWWIFKNETTGAFTVTVKVNGQTGVVVPQSTAMMLRCNGTDVVDVGMPVKGDLDAQATTVGGTVDAAALTFTPAFTAYNSRMYVRWVSAGPNTLTNPTVNVDTLGAKTIKKGASAALAAGDTGAAGYICEGIYNGTDLILQNPATAVQSGGSYTFSGVNVFSGDVSLTYGPLIMPSGRLTLTTLVPVLTSDVTAAATVYYTPYKSNLIALYDGVSWVLKAFAEMSQALTDTTKSPAATVASNPYDVFVWNDAGTMRATRGPSWLAGAVGGSTTTRGTGVGSTELELFNGVMVNKNAITNGPAARRGVFVGSFITNSGNAVDWVLNPIAALGGGNARVGLWNNYNRIRFSAASKDSTDSWASVGSSWRAMNGSASNRITIFNGLDEEIVDATHEGSYSCNSTNNGFCAHGIGLNSSTAYSGRSALQLGSVPTGSSSNTLPVNQCSTAEFRNKIGLGQNYLQALELAFASGTFYGDNASPLNNQFGITATFMA